MAYEVITTVTSILFGIGAAASAFVIIDAVDRGIVYHRHIRNELRKLSKGN